MDKHRSAIEAGIETDISSGRALRVLQLTDTHLYADSESRLLGQSTRRTLDLVLELATASLVPAADLILLTGDLVHDESPEGYLYLRRRLAHLRVPCYSLPGNHDLTRVMSGAFDGSTVKVQTSVHRGGWNFVFLDSTLPGKEGGHLCEKQLALLQESLAQRPNDPTLICLHHQPVPVGSDWMDTMALDNPAEFFAIIDRHPQVRGILWGHVHQEFAALRNGVHLLGSPSTCVQFKPGSREFALDEITPGFRWLELHPDGNIDTGVKRIATYPDPLDLSTGGY